MILECPPHSTGAAVDLTLADSTGTVLAMGGEIDAIGEESIPMFMHQQQNRIRPVMLRFGMEGDASRMT